MRPGARDPRGGGPRESTGRPGERLPKVPREPIARLLPGAEPRFDRDGGPRSAVRPGLAPGADASRIAKTCRAGMAVVGKYYAPRVENRLDAGAINVRRPKPPKEPGEEARSKDRIERPAATARFSAWPVPGPRL